MPKTPRENPRAARRQDAKKEEGDKVTRWIVISMVALVVVTAGVVSLFSQRGGTADEDLSLLDNFPISEPLTSVISDADDKAIVFNQGAPLKLSIWEDFQCPVCKSFEASLGGYVEELVKSGEAEVAFHTASFLGPESRRAANAGYCAADEGKFLDFHKAMYAVQSPIENAGFWNPETLIRIGEKVGITSESFATCVRDDAKRDLVNTVADSMMKYGVQGTPTVFINGKEWNRTSPSFDLEEFRSAVEAAKTE
jgi:protein-disulfide isomerase